MRYEGEFKQLSSTVLITEEAELSLSLRMTWGHWWRQKSRDSEINTLFLLCENEQTYKWANEPYKGFSTALYPLSNNCYCGEFSKGKFKEMFCSWCQLCHEPCRDCLFTTGFIIRQWIFLIHIYFTLFHPICILMAKYPEAASPPAPLHRMWNEMLLIWCLMILFSSLQFWYNEKQWNIIQHL